MVKQNKARSSAVRLTVESETEGEGVLFEIESRWDNDAGRWRLAFTDNFSPPDTPDKKEALKRTVRTYAEALVARIDELSEQEVAAA